MNGTDYGPSIDIEDVVDPTDTTPAGAAVRALLAGQTATNKRRKAQKDLVCKKCREKGHGTWRNHTCPKHNEYLAQRGM